MMPDWRKTAQPMLSLGSQSKRPGSLAGLHERRREHMGQFFTPTELADWVWRMMGFAMDRAAEANPLGQVSILDNSCGNGSLLRFAQPDKHVIGGIDVHAQVIEALMQDAHSAGFRFEFSSAGIEGCHPQGYGVGLLNPPFSIQVQSPHLKPGSATVFGKYGPDTAAQSHAYALQQALDACSCVAAILPATYADTLARESDRWPRLRAIYAAPPSSFREEKTDVSVAVCFFDRRDRKEGQGVLRRRIDPDFSTIDDLGLSIAHGSTFGNCGLREQGIDETEPSITEPVTGDARVRIGHTGSKITLRFACGLTRARVMNAILRERLIPHELEDRRYPKGVLYTGQAVLDLDVHLIQDDPVASFSEFIAEIHAAGGEPDVDPGILPYLRRRARRLAVESTPFRHTVFVPRSSAGGSASCTGVAKQDHVADPDVWGSPAIMAGTEIEFRRADDGLYRYRVRGVEFALAEDELNKRFTVASGDGDRWETVHEGRLAAFPERAHALKARARALGLDRFLTWGYQFDDLIEVSMARHATVCWDVGLGKARLAAALVLMSGCRHGLITTDAYLIPEMVTELEGLPIPREDWQVVERPEDIEPGALRKINLISYTRIRSAPDRSRPRTTYARLLRRRVGCHVADEGDLLRNLETQQTAALWMVSSKRKYVLTATPAANYPRSIFPVIAFSAGDASAAQPYGLRRWYLEKPLRKSTLGAWRGVDVIRDQFVTTEWVTREWLEGMDTGAKREVPKLRNLDAYRDAVSCHIKRRVAQEPDVARFISVPVPERKTIQIGWDDAHLAHYLQVADEFRRWFVGNGQVSRQRNLVALLARIKAVQIAAAIPQSEKTKPDFVYRGGLTSKQRWACDRLEELTDQGHKTVAYAEWPELLELIHRELSLRGIASVVIHGGKSVAQRTRELNEGFRFGPAPILLASLGVAQKGLNIWQADRACFLTRSWTPKVENQAAGRLLRPQQTRDVTLEFPELAGSIDRYQRQMVEGKDNAISAGLDWGTPAADDVEFVHLDSILSRFVGDLAAAMGCERHKVREFLALAA